MLTENTKAIIAWLNVCVLWGTTFLVIRIGVGHLPPMLFAGIRWVIAGTVFIAFLKWRGRPLPKANELVHLAVVGLALLGFANGLVVLGGAMDSERIDRPLAHNCAVLHGWIGISIAEGSEVECDHPDRPGNGLGWCMADFWRRHQISGRSKQSWQACWRCWERSFSGR